MKITGFLNSANEGRSSIHSTRRKNQSIRRAAGMTPWLKAFKPAREAFASHCGWFGLTQPAPLQHDHASPFHPLYKPGFSRASLDPGAAGHWLAGGGRVDFHRHHSSTRKDAASGVASRNGRTPGRDPSGIDGSQSVFPQGGQSARACRTTEGHGTGTFAGILGIERVRFTRTESGESPHTKSIAWLSTAAAYAAARFRGAATSTCSVKRTGRACIHSRRPSNHQYGGSRFRS